MTISAQTRRIKIGKSAKFLARAEDRGRSSLLLKQTVVGGILRRTAAMMRRTHNNMAASIFLLVVVSLMVGGARGVANSRNATNRQNSEFVSIISTLFELGIYKRKQESKKTRNQEIKKENKNSTIKATKNKRKYSLFLLITFLVEFLFSCFLL